MNYLGQRRFGLNLLQGHQNQGQLAWPATPQKRPFSAESAEIEGKKHDPPGPKQAGSQ